MSLDMNVHRVIIANSRWLTFLHEIGQFPFKIIQASDHHYILCQRVVQINYTVDEETLFPPLFWIEDIWSQPIRGRPKYILAESTAEQNREGAYRQVCLDGVQAGRSKGETFILCHAEPSRKWSGHCGRGLTPHPWLLLKINLLFKKVSLS